MRPTTTYRVYPNKSVQVKRRYWKHGGWHTEYRHYTPGEDGHTQALREAEKE